jgi:hypothetical protein
VYFKYALIASVKVERSFSKYKSILVDNWLSFTFENLLMYTVTTAIQTEVRCSVL